MLLVAAFLALNRTSCSLASISRTSAITSADRSLTAFHSSDLWYVFHSFKHSWRPFTAGDQALSNNMVEYYTNFAKYGNPNDEKQGVWSPYSAKNPKLMILDVNGNEASCTMSDKPEYKGSSFKWR